MLRALLDLVLPVDCVGCQAPGTVLCRRCGSALDGPARPARPTPSPPGLPAPFAVADYDGVARAAILGYKERGLVGLRAPLAGALSRAVVAALATSAPTAALLVPAPSNPQARRRRGDDVVAALTRHAARRLRDAGLRVAAVDALRHARAVADSAGLTAGDRAANLRGAFTADRRRLAGATVVLVDDLVTTGATLAEAARAVRAAGAWVPACATVAATRRRTDVVRVGLHNAGQDGYGAG